MTTLSLVLPQIGQPDTTEDVKLINGLTAIQSVINGNLDSTNLSAATSQSAGVNASGQTVKGSSIIATSQSTGSTTFTTLATPDQVTGVVLPTNGLIAVWYQGTWQESVNGAANAALFLGANFVKIGEPGLGAPTGALVAGIGGTFPTSTNVVLSSCPIGLSSVEALPLGSTTAYGGDVATGQVVGGGIYASLSSSLQPGGGPCYIFAAAGTYTVSVQFKASSGTVTASNRKLWVQALSFA